MGDREAFELLAKEQMQIISPAHNFNIQFRGATRGLERAQDSPQSIRAAPGCEFHMDSLMDWPMLSFKRLKTRTILEHRLDLRSQYICRRSD
jgi:hypothetical protein